MAVALGQALVDFALDGTFPDEHVSTLRLGPAELPKAIATLASAKSKLEAEIRTISHETANEVETWRTKAKSIQQDILRSKSLANGICRQADAPDYSGHRIIAAEEKADFLVRELNYNLQLRQALMGICSANRLLDEAERACNGRRILDALDLLKKSRGTLDATGVSRSCRVVRLLHIRADELEHSVHDVFDQVWTALVKVDVDHGRVSVVQGCDDQPMSLTDAVRALRTLDESDRRMTQLCHDLDHAIFAPRLGRLGTRATTLPSVKVDGTVLETSSTGERELKSLLSDLEEVFSFLATHLPAELLEIVSPLIMADFVPQLTSLWLDLAVPASLDGMDEYTEVIADARSFCAALESLGFSSGLEGLREWVDNSPTVWLTKCRDTALAAVRERLSHGLGTPKRLERSTTWTGPVRGNNGDRPATGRPDGTGVDGNDEDDWSAAWDHDEDDKLAATAKQSGSTDAAAKKSHEADGWGWGDDEEESNGLEKKTAPVKELADAHDKGDGEQWGWGEEEDDYDTHHSRAEAQKPQTHSTKQSNSSAVTKEPYCVSSLPEPILALIFAILEDGAMLTQDHQADRPVAAAAVGLFRLPTLALAMFRAIAPYYYSLDTGGNMYLFNDATFLAEQLTSFSTIWKTRPDVNARAKSLLNLDNDIQILYTFASRTHASELAIQKTILRDLLAGDQNLLTQDDTASCVDGAVARVRFLASEWARILAVPSDWAPAVAALVDCVAAKMTADVLDMTGISQEEAYRIAQLIANITELDDLFLSSRLAALRETGGNLVAAAAAAPTRPPDSGDDEVPRTAHYAPSWLRLKYLGEVLQSNLRDVRYLWAESELSLAFSADEVIDLINLSFEDNARTREVIREIRQNPRPTERRRVS